MKETSPRRFMKTFAIVLPLLQANLQIAMSHFKCWIRK